MKQRDLVFVGTPKKNKKQIFAIFLATRKHEVETYTAAQKISQQRRISEGVFCYRISTTICRCTPTNFNKSLYYS